MQMDDETKVELMEVVKASLFPSPPTSESDGELGLEGRATSTDQMQLIRQFDAAQRTCLAQQEELASLRSALSDRDYALETAARERDILERSLVELKATAGEAREAKVQVSGKLLSQRLFSTPLEHFCHHHHHHHHHHHPPSPTPPPPPPPLPPLHLHHNQHHHHYHLHHH
jgi:hypothetical protein